MKHHLISKTYCTSIGYFYPKRQTTINIMRSLSLSITLLVCVGAANVIAKGIDLMPESASFPTDDEELSELQDQVFMDFCLSSRDNVLNDLKGEANNLVDKLVKYGHGMTSGSKFLLERAFLKLFEQVENREAPVDDLFANYAYDFYIEDGIQKIKEAKTQSDRYMIALKHIWLIYSKFSSDEMESKVKTAKSQEEIYRIYKSSEIDRSNMADYIANISDHFLQSISELESKSSSLVWEELDSDLRKGCSKFNEYKNSISQKFDQFQDTIASENVLKTRTDLNKIGCLTIKRVLNAVTVCDFIKRTTTPIMGILKVNS